MAHHSHPLSQPSTVAIITRWPASGMPSRSDPWRPRITIWQFKHQQTWNNDEGSMKQQKWPCFWLNYSHLPRKKPGDLGFSWIHSIYDVHVDIYCRPLIQLNLWYLFWYRLKHIETYFYLGPNTNPNPVQTKVQCQWEASWRSYGTNCQPHVGSNHSEIVSHHSSSLHFFKRTMCQFGR